MDKAQTLDKATAQRMALNLYAELKTSKPRDRYKKHLRELCAKYKQVYIDAMIQEHGIDKVRAKCPSLVRKF